MPCLLGIDSGLTLTKAVVFDEGGRVVALARRQVDTEMARAHHVERDMNQLWMATCEAISEVVHKLDRPASEIAAVAVTAHGDGLYLLDGHQQPLGKGILSLDSRASGIVERWENEGVSAEALECSGQLPHVSAPAALLAWLREHEPERYAAIGSVLSCKDWLRYCLCDRLHTDLTEASTSFCDVREQRFSERVLELYALDTIAQALPQVARPDEIVGEISSRAASATGLQAGTPVVAGLHDVTASALGSGGHATDTLAVIAGTYSINEVVSREPVMDARWMSRNGLRPGEWNNMSISPASTTNYDWFIDCLCSADRELAESRGSTIHELLAVELQQALSRPARPLFHPYLFGSPHGPQASAGFLGLRGWHDRGDLLRAVMEGIAFNHRVHVDALRERFPASCVQLSGGISRNPQVAQLFANVFALPVRISETEEAAAWGAALCAGSALGWYARPEADPRDMKQIMQIHLPDPAACEQLEAQYQLHCRSSSHLRKLWAEIEEVVS